MKLEIFQKAQQLQEKLNALRSIYESLNKVKTITELRFLDEREKSYYLETGYLDLVWIKEVLLQRMFEAIEAYQYEFDNL